MKEAWAQLPVHWHGLLLSLEAFVEHVALYPSYLWEKFLLQPSSN